MNCEKYNRIFLIGQLSSYKSTSQSLAFAKSESVQVSELYLFRAQLQNNTFFNYLMMKSDSQKEQPVPIIVDGEQLDIQQDEKNSKEFEINCCKVTYLNEYEVLNMAGHDEGKDLQINNHLCCVQGNVMKKVSQIIINNRIVRITDTFCVTDLISESFAQGIQTKSLRIFSSESEAGKQKNAHIIKKRPYIPGTAIQKPQSNKNAVKNLIRIFRKWIDETQLSLATKINRKLDSLVGNDNFNNKLIVKIAECQMLNQKFLQFINLHATDLINQSKIIDKESHINSLKFYQKVMIERQDRNKCQKK